MIEDLHLKIFETREYRTLNDDFGEGVKYYLSLDIGTENLSEPFDSLDKLRDHFREMSLEDIVMELLSKHPLGNMEPWKVDPSKCFPFREDPHV